LDELAKKFFCDRDIQQLGEYSLVNDRPPSPIKEYPSNQMHPNLPEIIIVRFSSSNSKHSQKEMIFGDTFLFIYRRAKNNILDSKNNLRFSETFVLFTEIEN
jgi:hypothetical protein